MNDDPEAHLVDSLLRKQEPAPEPEWLRRMATGQQQMAPGQPLLPPSYRGSDDYVSYTRAWIVRRDDELIAGFPRELDARRWMAWAAAERGHRVDEFTVSPVTLMAARKAGPLFDGLPT